MLQDTEDKKLNVFADAYIECMLWADSPEGEDGDEWHTGNISDELREKIKSDCTKFYMENLLTLNFQNHQLSQAGHDFWLTRNGHGSNFLDRVEMYDKDDGETPTVAQSLYNAANEYPEVDLEMGDDGLIYSLT